MSLLAVKAAEELSRYIVDKYHYGIECNTCQYKYEYYSRLDLVSDCYSVCADDVTVTTHDVTIDCSGATPTFVSTVPCTPQAKILPCDVVYETREMQAFEINSYLYLEVVTSNNSVLFEFNSAVVNGTSYLGATRYFAITPDNVETQNVSGVNYIMNIINFLNSLQLPEFTFMPGASGRTMKVQFPQGTTWSVTSTANSSGELVHGATINQNGLSTLQLAVAGSYASPPYAGSVADAWVAGYEILKAEKFC